MARASTAIKNVINLDSSSLTVWSRDDIMGSPVVCIAQEYSAGGAESIVIWCGDYFDKIPENRY